MAKKTKLKDYRVRLVKEERFKAEVDVCAASEEEAEAAAENEADREGLWEYCAPLRLRVDIEELGE